MASPSTPPSRPIPITTSGRSRSASVSSAESPTTPGLSPGASSLSASSLQNPPMTNKHLPPSSPILSYFFGKDSPSKPSAPTKPTVSTSPQLPPLPDEDDEFTPGGKSTPMLGHHRAMSMGSWSRFPTSPIAGPSPMAGSNVPPNSPQDTVQRSAGVLRRLSLGAAFTRPTLPALKQEQDGKMDGNGLHRAKTIGPASAENDRFQGRRTARRATLSSTDSASIRPRAPSPMGERMLKGHFDGF
jgi:hypothetical protein